MVVSNLALLDGEQHQQLFLKHRPSEKASRHALGVLEECCDLLLLQQAVLLLGKIIIQL